ncbi:flagellar biosynthetic protein FliR [Xenophilus sp.]|uniref:flagellar biosynthetic protein FliR n=1 Tax=Xenophilus sp. TaxID=1873499 RepID=UPI0037DBFF06
MGALFSVQGLAPWLGSQALGWSQGVLLLSLRLGAFVALNPVFYVLPMPAMARLLLVMALAVLLSLGLGGDAPVVATATLMQRAMAELLLGATMALGVLLAFSAFSIAGQLLDVQIGFGIVQVFDPATQRQVSVLTSLIQYVGVLVFFLLDGHHALLQGLAYSVERFPPGQVWSLGVAVEPLIRQAGGIFALGFALAAPVVFCVLLTEFALGVVARNLPQVNMFTLGIPVKIVVGLVALSVWSSGIGIVMERVYRSFEPAWTVLLGSGPAGRTQEGAR